MNTTIKKYIILLVDAIVVIGLIVFNHIYENKREPVYNISASEREMLACLVYLEAGACGQECQRAVVSVVFNRLEDGRMGTTIQEVIYWKNAFAPARLIDTCIPDEKSYEAVDYVLSHGPTLPAKVKYFRDDYDHQWEGYEHYITYDNMYFGYFSNGDH